jgi:D-glycero-alpha-D-manno-heptose-7-phosphate kinase
MTGARKRIGRRVSAVAPIRICDIGGWTDTWFAKRGAVFNIAVYPYVEVQVSELESADRGRVTISLENYRESYDLDLNKVQYGAHPLIDAAVEIVGLSTDIALEINVFSSAPPGASTGTSASLTVALIGALSAFVEKYLTANEIAGLAHSVETEKLGLQCGIQDQLSSAFGGINYIQMQSFPHGSVSPVRVPDRTWWELESRLSVVYVGTPHHSSEIHEKVIKGLGKNPEDDPRIERLRRLAGEAKQCLHQGNFEGFGKVMDENTMVQRQLHAELVCDKFETVMEIARRNGALGCKVNGAGGDGGSVTILGEGDTAGKRRMEEQLQDAGMRIMPIYLSRFGVRVW